MEGGEIYGVSLPELQGVEVEFFARDCYLLMLLLLRVAR
jgi:hypothetical protein